MRHPASFRDPSGFVFRNGNDLLRAVHHSYRSEYDAIVDSGLFRELWRRELLVPHEEVPVEQAQTDQAYRVLRPQLIPFISYPYEWCFEQLREAALLTLDVQARALEFGFTLRDSSHFNTQFLGAKPIFIDSLSFERYRPGQPWAAYGQFCRHFLAPLLLMARKDERMGALLQASQDGVPLDLASKLLPKRTWLGPSTLIHLHLHARTVKAYEGRAVPQRAKEKGLDRSGLITLVESLRDLVLGLPSPRRDTEWAAYDQEHAYAPDETEAKERIIQAVIDSVRPRMTWDMGANVGRFSALARSTGSQVVAMDIDYGATARHFTALSERGETGILPIRIDLAQPSPGLGWANRERDSLLDRGPADLALALALVHHLRVSAGVPFSVMAPFFAGLAPRLIVEWVPRTDPQVERLLRSRPDTFPDYTREAFIDAFVAHFEPRSAHPVGATGRELLVFESRAQGEGSL